MQVSLVFLQEEISPEQRKLVERAANGNGDGAYYLSDRAVLIRSHSNHSAIGKELGIVEGKSIGVVFALQGSHYGYFDEKLWDWLERVEAS